MNKRKPDFSPEWVFRIWAEGAGDLICAADKDLPVHPLRRLFWKVRGTVLQFLFGWWWVNWEREA